MQLGNTPTLLYRAPIRPYGSFCYAPDDDQGGTQDPPTEPPSAEGADKPKRGKKSDTPPDPETLTLTKAQLKAQIDAAVAERDRRAEEKAKKDREAAEAEEAKKRGEFEKVAGAEKDRADKAEREVRTLRQSIALRDHLAEKHPDYIGCARYIAPLIPADVEGDDLAKAVEKTAAQYVKDNPRQTKGRAGAPDTPPRSRPSDSGANGKPEPQFNGAAARF